MYHKTKKKKITEEEKQQKYYTNLLKQDCFVASSIFLYSEYVLRHIHFTYYNNILLIDDLLKELEPRIFDIFIIISFIDYINEYSEQESVMQKSIENFMQSMLHSKIIDLENDENIIKKYDLKDINEFSIYELYKGYTDEEKKREIHNVALCSDGYGVVANREFTF